MHTTQAPYKASIGSEGRHCVDGPGNDFGYNAATLWPNLRFSSEADAKAAAELSNTAYMQGYEKARRDIRAALGLA